MGPSQRPDMKPVAVVRRRTRDIKLKTGDMASAICLSSILIWTCIPEILFPARGEQGEGRGR